jgi:hypothetical protein
LYESRSWEKGELPRASNQYQTKRGHTYIRNTNQVGGKDLQHAQRRMLADLIRDVHVQLPKRNGRRRSGGVPPKQEKALHIEDARLGPVLGLLRDRGDIVLPRHEEAPPECRSSGLGQAQPESVPQPVSQSIM